MAVHQRSEKNSPLDTILYEIDMLRHCAGSISQKKADEWTSEFRRAEYYLGIEGFLLHLRNLIAFFTNRQDQPTDLIINEPVVWAGQNLEQRQYSALIKAWKEFNGKYGSQQMGKRAAAIRRFPSFFSTVRPTATSERSSGPSGRCMRIWNLCWPSLRDASVTLRENPSVL